MGLGDVAVGSRGETGHGFVDALFFVEDERSFTVLDGGRLEEFLLEGTELV